MPLLCLAGLGEYHTACIPRLVCLDPLLCVAEVSLRRGSEISYFISGTTCAVFLLLVAVGIDTLARRNEWYFLA